MGTNTRAALSMDCLLSRQADEEMDRYRLAVAGSDADHVAYATAVTDRPVGIIDNGCDDAEEEVALALLTKPDTVTLKMAGTGSAGDLICPAVDGTGYGRAVPATGAVYICGRAMEDWTAGEEIAVLPIEPVLAYRGAHPDPSDGYLLRKVTAEAELSDFADGGSTSGTYSIADAIPQGYIPVIAEVVVTTAAAGGTTPTLALGIGADADGIAAAASVAATGRTAVLVAMNSNADPDAAIAAAKALLLTLAEASDFGNITAFACTVNVYCFVINPA